MKIPKNKAHLAPMAQITDIAFREWCVLYGVGLTTTELVSVLGILHKQEKTFSLMKKSSKEKYFSIQLFGSQPKDFAQASSIIGNDCSCIDINAGCPVPKVVSNGAGSALLKDPNRIGKIIRAISETSNIPVSVKIRIGLDEKNINVLETAKICEDEGANHITVHGRTTVQGYGGLANWDVIKETASKITIPVIGNGDIKTAEEVLYAKKKYGVHSCAIGRGASGNPFLFKEAKDLLSGEKQVKKLSCKEKIKAFREYIDLAKKYGTHFMHQLLQAQHITKGVKGSSEFRSTLFLIKDSEELYMAIEDFFMNALEECEDVQ
jgi:tRNA-dihydrouridine synthase B